MKTKKITFSKMENDQWGDSGEMHIYIGEQCHGYIEKSSSAVDVGSVRTNYKYTVCDYTVTVWTIGDDTHIPSRVFEVKDYATARTALAAAKKWARETLTAALSEAENVEDAKTERSHCDNCGSTLGLDCGDAEPDFNDRFCSVGCHEKGTKTETKGETKVQLFYPNNPIKKTFKCGDPNGIMVVWVPAVDCGRPCTNSTQLYESLDITSSRLLTRAHLTECPDDKAEQLQIVEHLLAARDKEQARIEGRLLTDEESFNGVDEFAVQLLHCSQL